LFEYGIMHSHHFKWVKEIRDELLPFIKDQAIGLTEAVGYDNETLRTAIGRDDGKIYETLFKWASEYNPVNDADF
jgi:acyl-CoA oxidase